VGRQRERLEKNLTVVVVESKRQCSTCGDVRSRDEVQRVPRTPRSEREALFGTPKVRYYCKDNGDCFPCEEDYKE